MGDTTGSRMVVRAVHRVSGRPWIFVSGPLDGSPLRVGDTVTVEGPDGGVDRGSIETIDLHSPDGLVTFALPAQLADVVKVGAVISKP